MNIFQYNLSYKIRLIRGTTRVKASKEEARALMIAPTTESFRRLFHMIGRLRWMMEGGGTKLPAPLPCNPSSCPVFVGSHLFALDFLLENVIQCRLIFFSMSPISTHLGNPASCPLFSHFLYTYTSCPPLLG